VLHAFPSYPYQFDNSNRISIYLHVSIYLWLCSPLLGLYNFFSFLIFHIVCRTPWRGISLSQGRYLHTGQHKHRINENRHPYTRVGFEPPIPAFERPKTVLASDHAATMIGSGRTWRRVIQLKNLKKYRKLLLLSLIVSLLCFVLYYKRIVSCFCSFQMNYVSA
jgi:hypothetical protein